MKKRYLLIDSENIQNRLFEIIDSAKKTDKILIFYTIHHSGRLEEYMKGKGFSKNVEFIECMSGSNALDLQLIGVLSYLIQKRPKTEFLIYSSDKGFRVAMKHWQSRHVNVEVISYLEPIVGADVFEFPAPITLESPSPKKAKKKKKKTAAVQPQSLNEKETPAEKQPPVTEAVKPQDASPAEQETSADDNTPLSDSEYVREICRSVQANDLSTIHRVLTVGFGTDGSKEAYNKFKKDALYREAMSKLYYPTREQRIKSLMQTALRYNSFDKNIADAICSILEEKGLDNMQQVYLSFIQKMPGSIGDRQNIYKAVKPYFPILENI